MATVKPQPTAAKDKIMNTKYRTANGNVYPIHQDQKTGVYYIIDKNGTRSEFTNKAGIELISQNKNQTISKNDYNPSEAYLAALEYSKTGRGGGGFASGGRGKGASGSSSSQGGGGFDTGSRDTTTTTTPTSNGGGGSTTGGSPSPSSAYMQQVLDEYNEIKQKLYDLEHPRVLSAREAAEHFDIPYDEAQFLKEYNDATHEYYDDMMNEQDRLRSVYARNNSQYAQQLANAYLDSYRNAAPTATGQGVRAANALSSMIQNQQSINENDYGMLQSYNNLASARDAELANNPLLAKQKYNDLGTYLSTLTANHNTSDVKQYVDQLDAYGQMYAANRLLAAADAESAATRYSGLTQAAQSNAQGVANGYNATNNFQQLYNLYYNTSNGNNKFASNKVANLINQGLQLGSVK